jgi:two-component SAPR family response regulator
VSSVFVSVLRGAVERDFLPIPLTGRERELAMFLAVAKRPADGHHLAQSLWNDSGSGRGLVKVNVHRLRAKLGREAIVTELSAYRFGDTVRVDVRELELLMDARSDDFVSEADRERALNVHGDLLLGRPRAFSDWGWFAPTEERLQRLTIELSQKLVHLALRRQNINEAQRVLRGLRDCGLGASSTTAFALCMKQLDELEGAAARQQALTGL